jgi:4-amino-4-deoxy-L-arabinose transferase-like glycosyltransferase
MMVMGQIETPLPPEPSAVTMMDRAVRLLRGPQDHPWWSRSGLILITLLTTGMYTWALDASGYGNEYYAAAAYSGSLDWNAWLFGSIDTASFISVDKPPFSLWVTGLSVRVFGLSLWSVLLPHALAGVGTVLVLHRTVRRWHGHAAALAAALAMAVTPIAVVMARYNNPDAILTLLLTGSLALAYSAARSGSGWRLAGSGVLVGLAFLTKTTQALLVIPAIAVVYLVAAPVSVGRRILHGLGAAGAALVAAGWWVLLAETSSSAPYFGQTDTGSFLDYIFGYNGLGRVTGEGVGPGDPFGGGGGWSRLFNEEIGGQVSWLIPIAIVALGAGLWSRRGRPRTDGRRAGWLMWGTFFAVQLAVFSLMEGVFHPYYSLTIAPAIAALTGAGTVVLWRLYRESAATAWLLPAVVVGTGVWAAVLLGRTSDFMSGFGTVILVLCLAAAAFLLVMRYGASSEPRLAFGAIMVSGALLLAGPMSYAFASIGADYSGGDPKAGPGEAGRPVGTAPAAAGGVPGLPPGAPDGRPDDGPPPPDDRPYRPPLPNDGLPPNQDDRPYRPPLPNDGLPPNQDDRPYRPPRPNDGLPPNQDDRRRRWRRPRPTRWAGRFRCPAGPRRLPPRQPRERDVDCCHRVGPHRRPDHPGDRRGGDGNGRLRRWRPHSDCRGVGRLPRIGRAEVRAADSRQPQHRIVDPCGEESLRGGRGRRVRRCRSGGPERLFRLTARS